jgi:rod shape determining protein RodA
MVKKLFRLDWILVAAVLLLSGISLLVLYSFSDAETFLTGSVFLKQVIFMGVGIVGMIFFALLDYHYLRSYARYIYFAMLAVLLAVVFFGVTLRGTSGWISVGSFNLQPVEFSKLALLIFMAGFVSKKKNEISETGRLIISLVLSGIMVFLVLKQPDFGSSIVLMAIWIGMILISSLNKKIFFIILALGIIVSGSGWFRLETYQKERIANFLNPESDVRGSGYNVAQALVAVGSGGITGKGIGHGSQSQLNFLPEKHTDFIFAVITEELGFVGATVILVLYGVIFFRIRLIALRAGDNFGFLVASGSLIMFLVQVGINIGMNVGIVPVAGIPLPFLSYGGSSLVVSYITIGILLNISQTKSSGDMKIIQSY